MFIHGTVIAGYEGSVRKKLEDAGGGLSAATPRRARVGGLVGTPDVKEWQDASYMKTYELQLPYCRSTIASS
jgi:hypothetical protein